MLQRGLLDPLPTDHPLRRFRKRPGHFPTHDTDLARASSALGGVDSTCLRCRRAALRVRRSPSGDRHDHRSASGANDPAPPGPRGRRSHLHPFTGPAPSRIRLAHSPRRPQRKHSRSATPLPPPAPDHGYGTPRRHFEGLSVTVFTFLGPLPPPDLTSGSPREDEPGSKHPFGTPIPGPSAGCCTCECPGRTRSPPHRVGEAP